MRMLLEERMRRPHALAQGVEVGQEVGKTGSLRVEMEVKGYGAEGTGW